MKIIHTADWHLGSTLYEYDRSYEHACFLQKLKHDIIEQQVDCVLISGDIFHTSNPSYVAERQFSAFLVDIKNAIPKIQVIAISGNHDSGFMLDTTGSYCSLTSNIYVVGSLPYKSNKQEIDYSKMVMPIFDSEGKDRAIVIAIPFMRSAYLHGVSLFADEMTNHNLQECTQKIFENAYTYAQSINPESLPIIVMAHDTVVGATSHADQVITIGGSEAMDPKVFQGVDYVAMGHIHLAQSHNNIYYPGSPFSINVGEADYKHGYNLLDIQDKHINCTTVALPIFVDVVRIPHGKGAISVDEALVQIANLPYKATEFAKRPYVNVFLSYNPFTTSLTDKNNMVRSIQDAVDKKIFRLGGVKFVKEEQATIDATTQQQNSSSLRELTPLEVFDRLLASRGGEFTGTEQDELRQTFQDILQRYEQEKAQQNALATEATDTTTKAGQE